MKSVAGDTTVSSVSLCALGAIIGRYVRFKNLELLLYLLISVDSLNQIGEALTLKWPPDAR